MSRENVEVVRGIYDAFNLGDWEALLGHLAPAFEFETDPRHPRAGVYRGKEASSGCGKTSKSRSSRRSQSQGIFARGDQVVALITMRRRPRGSTAVLEIQIGEVWTLREGKAVRGQVFAEQEKALAAVGLRE